MVGRRIKITDFVAELKKEERAAIRAIKGAVRTVGNQLLADSIREVPKNDGQLRSSKFVTKPERSGDQISAFVGYGGFAAVYALRVHEMPEGTNWTTSGTGPKYLERPMLELRPRFASEVSAMALKLYLQSRRS